MIVKISSYKQLCFCHAPLGCVKLLPLSKHILLCAIILCEREMLSLITTRLSYAKFIWYLLVPNILSNYSSMEGTIQCIYCDLHSWFGRNDNLGKYNNPNVKSVLFRNVLLLISIACVSSVEYQNSDKSLISRDCM